MTNDVFSIDSRYVYKRPTDGLGAFGGRHFEITAGNESGSGMLYTCVLPVQSNDLIYPLLGNSSCKQINIDVIDVADLFINTYPGTDPNGLAQLSAAAENYNLIYDLSKLEDIADLRVDMMDLRVGYALKI